MPSSPYIEVSQETRARIAEIRRRASADEGRQVTNDEIVRRLIDAAEGRTVTNDEIVSQLIDAAEGRITGTAELFEHPKGMQFTVSIGIPEIRLAGAADPEREARRAMIEYLEDVVGLPKEEY